MIWLKQRRRQYGKWVTKVKSTGLAGAFDSTGQRPVCPSQCLRRLDQRSVEETWTGTPYVRRRAKTWERERARYTAEAEARPNTPCTALKGTLARAASPSPTGKGAAS